MRLTSAVPPVASSRAPAAAPRTIGSCRSEALTTRSMVMPADTRPTTCPVGARTGTIACTSGPIVPVICSTTTPPPSAGSMLPTNFLPIRSGSGWV